MTYIFLCNTDEIEKDSEKLYEYQKEHPDTCIYSIRRYMTQEVSEKMKKLAEKEPYKELYEIFEKNIDRKRVFDEAYDAGLIDEGTTYPFKTFVDYWSELYDHDVQLQKYFIK